MCGLRSEKDVPRHQARGRDIKLSRTSATQGQAGVSLDRCLSRGVAGVGCEVDCTVALRETKSNMGRGSAEITTESDGTQRNVMIWCQRFGRRRRGDDYVHSMGTFRQTNNYDSPGIRCPQPLSWFASHRPLSGSVWEPLLCSCCGCLRFRFSSHLAEHCRVLPTERGCPDEPVCGCGTDCSPRLPVRQLPDCLLLGSTRPAP